MYSGTSAPSSGAALSAAGALISASSAPASGGPSARAAVPARSESVRPASYVGTEPFAAMQSSSTATSSTIWSLSFLIILHLSLCAPPPCCGGGSFVNSLQ